MHELSEGLNAVTSLAMKYLPRDNVRTNTYVASGVAEAKKCEPTLFDDWIEAGYGWLLLVGPSRSRGSERRVFFDALPCYTVSKSSPLQRSKKVRSDCGRSPYGTSDFDKLWSLRP